VSDATLVQVLEDPDMRPLRAAIEEHAAELVAREFREHLSRPSRSMAVTGRRRCATCALLLGAGWATAGHVAGLPQ
jgi:hypothetical protein